ncbi:hypothetical protein R6Z07F_001648 [Ovis aries]
MGETPAGPTLHPDWRRNCRRCQQAGLRIPIGPCATPAGQDSGQRLVPLGSFRRRRSELIRELKRASKVGSEVSTSVTGQYMFCALFFYHKKEKKDCSE